VEAAGAGAIAALALGADGAPRLLAAFPAGGAALSALPPAAGGAAAAPGAAPAGALLVSAAPAADGPMNTLTAALSSVPITCTAATTGPSRSVATTTARLNLALNAYGGIVRWVPFQTEEWGIIGVSTSISESSLSNYTGGATAPISTNIVYEPY
jgi:hypothetical protein